MSTGQRVLLSLLRRRALAPPCQAGPRTQASLRNLTAAAAPPPRAKTARPAPRQVLHPLLQRVRQDAAWLAAQQRRAGFLCADVSGGVERYQIPCFNEVDEEPPPADLEYVRHAGLGPVLGSHMPRCTAGSAGWGHCARPHERHVQPILHELPLLQLTA